MDHFHGIARLQLGLVPRLGAIQVLRNADGGGRVSDFLEKSVTAMFNVISIMRGWVGVQFPEK